jgi:RNA polymerase sigma factor (TIGR02999 family)
MTDDVAITQLLKQAEAGEPERLSAVFEALYPELRRLAASRLRHDECTFTPTALVNEFYLRLSAGEPLSLVDRRHFFVAAAKAMRWIVVDHARRRNADKRGGGAAPITLSERLESAGDSADVLALHEGLDALDQVNPRLRELVELRYFIGLEFSEVAQLLQCSERTAKREWARARAFLYAQLAQA